MCVGGPRVAHRRLLWVICWLTWDAPLPGPRIPDRGWRLSSRTKESPSSYLREDDTPPSSSPPPVSLLPPRKTCDKKNVRHYSLARTLHEFMLFTSSSTIPRWTLSLLRASTNCSMRSAMSSTERCTSFRAARWILTGPGGGGTGKLCEFAPLSSF